MGLMMVMLMGREVEKVKERIMGKEKLSIPSVWFEYGLSQCLEIFLTWNIHSFCPVWVGITSLNF